MSRPDAGWIEAYEQMRRQRRGPGYELVRRGGLVRWMAIAAAYLPAASSPPAPASTPSARGPERGATSGDLPPTLYPALTQLLAGVALSWLREERS